MEEEEPKFWRGFFALIQMLGGIGLGLALAMVTIWAIFKLASFLLEHV